MNNGKDIYLLFLMFVGVTVGVGSERKTRALPFPDSSTVGVSIILVNLIIHC